MTKLTSSQRERLEELRESGVVMHMPEFSWDKIDYDVYVLHLVGLIEFAYFGGVLRINATTNGVKRTRVL